MSDEIKPAERLEKRANSYRFGGPSSEHTAKLLEEAAFALRTALAERDEARAERDANRSHIRAQSSDIMTLGALVYADEHTTWKARAKAAEARLEELTRERDEAKAALEHRDTECGYLAGKVARTEADHERIWLNQREAFNETVRLAQTAGMPELPGSELGLAHMRSMQERILPEFSEAKLGRWLGWAQCALVAADVGVTLEDMKALNMRYSDRQGGSDA